MNNFKKASDFIYFCSAFNIYALLMNKRLDNFFRVKNFPELQKNIPAFCEGISTQRESNTIIYDKKNSTTEKRVECEINCKNTSKQILKEEERINVYNESLIKNIRDDNIIYNRNSRHVKKNEGYNYHNSKAKKSISFLNGIVYTEKYNEKGIPNDQDKDDVNYVNPFSDKICSNVINTEEETCNDGNNGNELKTELNKELTKDIINLIENILKKHKIVLFMKGTALNPFCKYSRQAIHILKLNKVKEIHTVNILENEKLRNALKIYSKWPTFPQLYVKGTFIGGIDRVQLLHDNNKLKELIENLLVVNHISNE
ncbi:glutaredoxin-like protein, putative [Plasmodium malariae]|uniref:Glutaredoxin-like protein, putative n=1 Tax=Plasmodium malariae TaxID=5858 RepID=A0A1C3KL48_PLAMA|nr:glutaredoxin-like protein, putative [Plasmodium malariae]